MRRDCAHDLFSRSLLEGFSFDVEILFLARRQGLRVKEVPVLWAHQENTKISPIRDGVRMFTELLTIRWYAVTGRYDTTRTETAAHTR